MVMIPDEVSSLVTQLAAERGVTTGEVLIEAVNQLAGRDPNLVARVTRSIERHRTILDRLAAT